MTAASRRARLSKAPSGGPRSRPQEFELITGVGTKIAFLTGQEKKGSYLQQPEGLHVARRELMQFPWDKTSLRGEQCAWAFVCVGVGVWIARTLKHTWTPV